MTLEEVALLRICRLSDTSESFAHIASFPVNLKAFTRAAKGAKLYDQGTVFLWPVGLFLIHFPLALYGCVTGELESQWTGVCFQAEQRENWSTCPYSLH